MLPVASSFVVHVLAVRLAAFDGVLQEPENVGESDDESSSEEEDSDEE